METTFEDIIQKKLEEYSRKLSGDVSLKLLFPNEFIKMCSTYQSTESFFNDAGVYTQEDFEKFLLSPDEFVRNNTIYENWQHMLDTAAKRFAKKKQQLLRDNAWIDETFDSPHPFDNIHIPLNFTVT